MRVAVCLKQVVTREWPVRVDQPGTWVRDEDASWELNEPDVYALEEALRLKEKHGAEVVALSAGPPRVTQVLREALARGADHAIHVAGDHLVSADASTTAHALADAIARRPIDLVLTGLQSADQGFASVGVMVAERLGIPHSTIIMALEIDAAGVRVKRELEGGWFQWLRMPMPALLTIQSGINQLRYATLRGIMAAKRKEIEVVPAPVPAAVHARVVSLAVPARSRDIRLMSGPPAAAATELVKALRDAHVL